MAFNENKNRNRARIWTITVHVLLLLWFALTGLKYQDPPPEEGIAINFGYSEEGFGNNTQAAPVTPPPPAPETPVEETPVTQEEVVTQDIEDAPVIEETKEEPKQETPKEEVKEVPKETPQPDPEPEPDPQPTEEEIKQQKEADRLNKLFNTNNKGSGQGEGETKSGGDQGSEDGDPLNPNRKGNGGVGNNGNFWIKGENIELPKPKTGCNYRGIVVVRIVVNENGKVTETAIPSNSSIPTSLPRQGYGSNSCLSGRAQEAALKSTWTPDIGNYRRVGFVVYRFELE